MSPLETNGLIRIWYDRKINAGRDFQNQIDCSLESADIICLFISANFLSSAACMNEKEAALKLRRKKGVQVVPIVLSRCGWLDDTELKPLLALPTDGRPIMDFPDRDTAWNVVYDGLKLVIDSQYKIKNIKITDKFWTFLVNSELLTNAHAHKNNILLDEIFVYPELVKYDESGEYEKKISSEKLLTTFADNSRILIAGEDRSGKTALCKKLFVELRERNYIPIYIHAKPNKK
jgi:hypothetical protein